MATTLAETIYVLHGPAPDTRADGVKTDGTAIDGIAIGAAGIGELNTAGRELTDQELNDRHAAIAELCAETSARYGLKVDCRQVEDEDDLIDLIRKADADQAAGLVIDAARYRNTSAALHQVLATVRIPMVDVTAGERRADESFRHRRFAAKPPLATLSGFGIDGYRLAILGLAASTGVSAPA